ncbi:unnamed protein product [Hymenolepis diminuta]|uniref:Zf-CCHC_6 domain-containing protein n=1 Tax=Hymenolepis diminuta TaxID=6216 RepID=A0A0R3SWA1_HYMDI|nr:unnamed protein product [Hymenolepis diminuta]
MDPADLTYEKMIYKLGSVVDDNSSLFNLIISEDENVHHYVGIVDRLCIGLRFGSLEENQLKCFIFILGLRSPCHASVPLGQEVSGHTPHPTIIRRILEAITPKCRFCRGRRHHRECPIEDVAARTAMTMVTKKSSIEILLRTVQRGKTRTTREH